MRPICGGLLVFFSFFVLGDVAPGQYSLAESEGTATEENENQELKSVAEQAAKAVVRINISSKNARSGVIVSAEGHVFWTGSAHRMPDLSVTLPSGESVSATNLGWSEEWRIGLLKLAGDQSWPHVELGSTEKAAANDACFAVGYAVVEDQPSGFSRSPAIKFGKLTRVSPSHWFSTNLNRGAELLGSNAIRFGTATFNAEGKLLGIEVPSISNYEPVSTAVEVLNSHWQDLVDDKNLDWVRYPPSKESHYWKLPAQAELDRIGFVERPDNPTWIRSKDIEIDEDAFEKAKNIAAATTVRIRLRSIIKGKRLSKCNYWSGVLISPEGHITTCAHTEQVAGEELMVVLPDNREVTAIALGTNWVSDIGLVKITEEGPWEYAELGDSSIVGPEDAVLCAGFPTPHRDPLPPVTTAILPLQQTPFVGWNHQLVIGRSMALPGGASGGGVFDRDGRLVAVYIGPSQGHRIEMFRAQEEYLRSE